ncbi:MAG TPA: hypothetical protein VF669_20445 [Tepidisphaeraceae bacterium]|jgi:DNA/RNA endonuclease YhcR with UshA esterase domain
MQKLSALLALICLSVAIPTVHAEDKPATEQPAASQPAGDAQKIEATETDALKAAEGKTLAVHGTIARTAKSPSGSILFINFEGVDRSGFTAIVHKDDLDAVKDFGEQASDLVGKEVTITGPIKIYRDKPQIEIKKSDQIKVAAGSDEKKEDKKEEDKKPEEKKD